MESDSTSSPNQERNWLELPPEIISLIFKKVGTVDILLRVQLVCSSWRKLCKEPHHFRSIHIYFAGAKDEDDISNEEYYKMFALAKEAVSRSCGQLVDFSIEYFQYCAVNHLLDHIIAKQCPVRRFRMANCEFLSQSPVYDVLDVAKKLPLLEELEICYCLFFSDDKVIKTFGRSCPLLKSFTLNYKNLTLPSTMYDDEALAIAQSMPELRHLNLSGGHLTNNGLQAILDGCPHLNFLDLSLCSNLNFAGDLVKMCMERNIELKVSGKAASKRRKTWIG